MEFRSTSLSSNTKISLHNNPKGVIQFIGAFVFGSFPEKSYKYLFECLHNQQYSLVVYSFPLQPFNLNHWKIAIQLLVDMYNTRISIIKEISCNKNLNREEKNTLINLYLSDSNYSWLGHSLGCKYTMLLEILSNDNPEILSRCLNSRNMDQLQQDIFKLEQARESTIETISKIINKPCKIRPFIRDQPCLLLAPEINNSVQIFSKSFHPPSGLGFPSRNETKCLIENSQNIFTLTAILSFNLDNIAKDDVAYLVNQLNSRGLQPFLHKIFWGWHFEPQAIHVEHLVCCIDSILQELRQRHLNGVSQQIQCRYELNQG